MGVVEVGKRRDGKVGGGEVGKKGRGKDRGGRWRREERATGKGCGIGAVIREMRGRGSRKKGKWNVHFS